MKHSILNAEIKISADVITQQVEDETVLLDLGSDRYFGLDSTATRIWELLRQEKSPTEILQQMSLEFDAGIDELEQDLTAHLDMLAEAGLIIVSN